MRKRIVGQPSAGSSTAAARWLDVERHAEVEVTSEDATHPIELALHPAGGAGWRAAEPGSQTIRLHFDEPQRLERIRVVFEERDTTRTQEFVLRWSPDRGRSYREIVRQQYTFSPPGTAREVEEYAVDLGGVTTLELNIVPQIGGSEARASLEEWLLA